VTLATDREVDVALAALPGWRRQGDALVRVMELRDFDEAMRLAQRVAACAVDYGRRPDMCISEFNHLRLSVANPHHAGFTRAELRLLERVSAVLDEPRG
jgi:4a-hydroxytetrahydrobiopterin dehydratase